MSNEAHRLLGAMSKLKNLTGKPVNFWQAAELAGLPRMEASMALRELSDGGYVKGVATPE